MATIRDVAKESGVSVATVSYVLNNGPRPVRAETRQRVLTVMGRLDYHPNAMARGLVRRRMNTLGVLFASVESAVVTNVYASGILQGIFTAASELGFNVTLFTEPWRDARHSAPRFRDRRTDGVLIVSPPQDSDMVAGLAALGLPLVVISLSQDTPAVPSVDVDNAKGACLATEHLLSLGHTRIAHLMGEKNLISTSRRRDGFRAALASAGLAVPERFLVPASYSAYYTDATRSSIRNLLTQPDPPTAIFAGNDLLALAVIEAARELGIDLPGELSIMGFDDSPVAPMASPPLTTIQQPLSDIGKTATRLLVERVEGKPVPPTAHLLEPALVARGSTAPPT